MFLYYFDTKDVDKTLNSKKPVFSKSWEERPVFVYLGLSTVHSRSPTFQEMPLVLRN